MAFTVSYTVIPNSDIDPDSPLTTGLFQDIRDNITFVLEYTGGGVGGGYTPVAAHNHDGVNSSSVAALISSDIAYISSASFSNVEKTLISISGVTLSAGDKLFVWANYARLTGSTGNFTMRIRHNGSILATSSASDSTMYAQSTSARAGSLTFTLATGDPFSAGLIEGIKMQYMIIRG